MTDPGIEVAALRPFMHVTCDALYYIAKDDTGTYSDVDKEPEALLLVCDLKFTPNTTTGMILVGDTLQVGAIPDYFEFKNVGNPAGAYPWPIDIQLLNLDDVNLNPRGANYTVELTPVGYVGSSGVVSLLNWEQQVGVIPCVDGTNSVPLLQWLPLAATNSGKPALLGPAGKSAYDIAVVNGFVGTEAEWSASLTNAAQSFATAASGYADAALASKNAAAQSASDASGFASNANVSAGAAAGSAANAAASADTANTKVTDATAQAVIATDQAVIATGQAAISTTKAGEALVSANNAAATLANAVVKTTFDAKGDMLVGSANDTIVRLPVGANGSIPMADSNAASGLSYQSPSPLLVNLIANGDFSNGTTGWTTSAGSLSNVSGVGQQTGDGTNLYQPFYATDVTTTPGNKFYFRASVKTIGGAATTLRLYIGGYTTTFAGTPADGVWAQISSILTPTTNNGSVYITSYWSDNATQSGKLFQVDNVLCINLTACFGAGKEPSKAEMDAIMARWPNSWFAKETPQLLPTYDWLKLTQNASTNLITNGDFSNGSSGWSDGGGYSSLAASNNELTATVGIQTASGRVAVANNVAFSSSRVYYTRLDIYPSVDAQNTYISYRGFGVSEIFTPAASVWTTLTFRGSSTEGTGPIYVYHNTTNYALGQSVKLRRVMTLDLTSTFGAGLEPTKTEMDVLLSRYPNSWFNGTVNDLKQFYDPLNRIGKGSPYNVITPRQKGETWTDLDQTNGAYKWLATGTTTGSWIVVDGNTGWRLGPATLSNGWTTSSSSFVRLCRTGSTVRMSVYSLDGRSATATTWMTPPTGFQIDGRQGISVIMPFSNGVAGSSITLNGTTILTSVGSLYSGMAYSHFTWETADPWPTTLPGTPA